MSLLLTVGVFTAVAFGFVSVSANVAARRVGTDNWRSCSTWERSSSGDIWPIVFPIRVSSGVSSQTGEILIWGILTLLSFGID